MTNGQDREHLLPYQRPSSLTTFYRDASSATLAGNCVEQTTAVFDPTAGTLSFGISSSFMCEEKNYYKNIFENITPSKSYNIDRSFVEKHPPDDLRFYISIQVPAGFIFKIEILDLGSSLKFDQEIPSLARIIRYELLRESQRLALSKIQQGLFGSSRERFLNNVMWPETTNQLSNLLNRQRLANQVLHAEKELRYRQLLTFQRQENPPPPHSCFSDMPYFDLSPSEPSLKSWICAANKKLNTRPRNSHVALPSEPYVPLVFNPYRRMNLSFILYGEEFDSTSKLVGRAEHTETHPRNISSLAQVALSAPLLVDVLPEEPIHPFDKTPNISKSHINETALEIIQFLSFGMFKPKKPIVFPETTNMDLD